MEDDGIWKYPPVEPGRALPIDHGAPLWMHEKFPGCRLKLVCGSCSWSKTYNPVRIIRGLQDKRHGDRQTAVGAVAHYVQWPCPACRRMRWGSILIAGETGDAPQASA